MGGKNIDDYMSTVDEEDCAFLETDDNNIAVDTNNDCMEISKYLHDHFQPDQPEEEDKNGGQSIWNPNDLSFWEIRREGELLRAEDYKRKHQHNSSCGNCFAQINCQFCEVNM